MIFGAILLVAAATSDRVCDADSVDQVCLMQFMNRKAKSGQLDFNSALEEMMNSHGHDHDHDHNCPECPGSEFVASADHGLCSHGGSDVEVLIDRKDIEEFFGDNVLVVDFKYFLESNPHRMNGEGVGTELINPDVHHHQYPVGETRVRVEGYDIAENMRACHRTVIVMDEQAPSFAERPSDLDSVVTLRFPDGTCTIDSSAPFNKYDKMGFVERATDNCDTDVEIIRSIIENGVQIDLGANISGPGNRTIVYTAVDDFSDNLYHNKSLHHRTTSHTVTLQLLDKSAPDGFTGCPNSTVIEVEAHETSATHTWTPPVATGDNCDEFFDLPPAVEQHTPPRHPGQHFPIGVTTVTYAFSDAHGNTLAEMCSFTIEVIPKAHPVVITCPGDVFANTVMHANFGIAKWAEPTVMQHDVELTGPDHIIYDQGVESGMPFPFGITDITVKAKGQITGDRWAEDEQVDECTFRVTIGDPEDPKVDGRMFRCQEGSVGKTPYELCSGKAVQVDLFASYPTTHGYEVTGTTDVDGECCRSDHGHGYDHHCTLVEGADASSPAHYCTPMM
jgi:hypothetical protein